MSDVQLARRIDEAAGLCDHEEGASEGDVHAAQSRNNLCKNLSIEIFDRGHRKIPFEEGLDYDHIANVPAESEHVSPGDSSGPQRKDKHNEGEDSEEGRQEDREEGRQEVQEVSEFPSRARETAVIAIRVFSAALISAVLFAARADAVTVSNRDGGDHRVTVIEGEAKQDHVVKAGESLTGVCLSGCLMRLDDSSDEPYELEGPEITWIEGGELLEEQSDGTQDADGGNAVPSSGASPAPLPAPSRP